LDAKQAVDEPKRFREEARRVSGIIRAANRDEYYRLKRPLRLLIVVSKSDCLSDEGDIEALKNIIEGRPTYAIQTANSVLYQSFVFAKQMIDQIADDKIQRDLVCVTSALKSLIEYQEVDGRDESGEPKSPLPEDRALLRMIGGSEELQWVGEDLRPVFIKMLQRWRVT
jgi:hypothetical protein